MQLFQRIIFAVNNGIVKPAKHLQLGVALKSITGERKLNDILNRFGYTVSYNVVEDLETKLTYSAFLEEKLLPHGLHPVPNLHTGLTFDNYDCFVET